MSALRRRARLHRPDQDRQVRGLLPRPRRQPAGARRLGGRDARPARLARRPARGRRRRRSPCRSTTPRRSRASLRRAGAEIAAVIVEPVVGNMGCVPPRPGLPAGGRGDLHRRARGAADLRRSDDGLPPRAGRRAGTLRHHAGHHLPRQDHRRRAARLAAFGGRARDHGRRRPGRPGLPGGDALGQPAGGDRRADDAPAAAARGFLRAARAGDGAASRGADRGGARSGRRDDEQPRRLDVHDLLHPGPGHRLDDRGPQRPRAASAASSTPCSTRGSTSRPRSSKPASSRPRTPTRSSGARSRRRGGPSPECKDISRGRRGINGRDGNTINSISVSSVDSASSA